MKAKLDSVHQMLGLQKGQALIGADHPLCLEYKAKYPDMETPEFIFPAQAEKQIFVASTRFSEFPVTRDFMAMLGTLLYSETLWNQY